MAIYPHVLYLCKMWLYPQEKCSFFKEAQHDTVCVFRDGGRCCHLQANEEADILLRLEEI